MIRAFFVWALILAPVAAISQDHSAKFRLDGDRLVFDTYTVPEGLDDDLQSGDAEGLRTALQKNPDVTTLVLNSGGGSLWGARKMSDIVIDYGLDTHVDGDCSSSCVRVFLAGTQRSMARGSRIGFHINWWNAKSVESYYTGEAEKEGWNDPFEFASWMYEDTQKETHESLMYMVERGVNPLFAIQTMQASAGDMWYPYRIKLRAAGVLTQ